MVAAGGVSGRRRGRYETTCHRYEASSDGRTTQNHRKRMLINIREDNPNLGLPFPSVTSNGGLGHFTSGISARIRHAVFLCFGVLSFPPPEPHRQRPSPVLALVSLVLGSIRFSERGN